MQFHEFFNLLASEWWNCRSLLSLGKYCIEALLAAHSIEHVELGESQAMSLTIFKFLEKSALRLIVEIGKLGKFSISDPNRRVTRLCLLLNGLFQTLRDRQRILCHVCLRMSLTARLRSSLLIKFAFWVPILSRYYKLMLHSNNLVDSVPDARQSLTVLVKLVLRNAEVHEGIKLELPLILPWEGLQNLLLLFTVYDWGFGRDRF